MRRGIVAEVNRYKEAGSGTGSSVPSWLRQLEADLFLASHVSRV